MLLGQNPRWGSYLSAKYKMVQESHMFCKTMCMFVLCIMLHCVVSHAMWVHFLEERTIRYMTSNYFFSLKWHMNNKTIAKSIND